MKKRVFGLDLARVICAFGIIFYHYAVGCFGDQSILYFANGNIAGVVTSFFIISGITLHMSNKQISISLKKEPTTGRCELLDFYKKRALSIFPMFYMVFFCLMPVYTINLHGEDRSGNCCCRSSEWTAISIIKSIPIIWSENGFWGLSSFCMFCTRFC